MWVSAYHFVPSGTSLAFPSPPSPAAQAVADECIGEYSPSIRFEQVIDLTKVQNFFLRGRGNTDAFGLTGHPRFRSPRRGHPIEAPERSRGHGVSGNLAPQREPWQHSNRLFGRHRRFGQNRMVAVL